jgi:hypothetical protein
MTLIVYDTRVFSGLKKPFICVHHNHLRHLRSIVLMALSGYVYCNSVYQCSSVSIRG